MNRLERARDHLRASAETKYRIIQDCLPQIMAAADLLTETFRAGGKVLLCGNGGSAADCQHLATEFVSRLSRDFERPGLPAIALTTDTSFLTAYANDLNFDGVFARQVEVLGRPGDILIGISTSGSSVNVIRAMETAQQRGLKVIALTGRGGGLARQADVAIAVPSAKTQLTQEAHLTIEHILCELVEQALFGMAEPAPAVNTVLPLGYGMPTASPATRVRVGVGMVIYDKNGRILLERRSDCGWWGLPGGRMEAGESAVETALREAREETGLTVKIIRLLGVYSEPVERIVVYPDKPGGVQLVDIVLEAEIVSGELTCSAESLELRFFAPDCLPAEIVPPARAPLADAVAGRRGMIR